MLLTIHVSIITKFRAAGYATRSKHHHVRIHIDRNLRHTSRIKQLLMVMTELVSRTPECTIAPLHLIIVENISQSVVVIIGTTRRSIHITMVDSSSVEHVVALITLSSTEAHEVVFTLNDAVPDFNQLLHVNRSIALAISTRHVHDNQFALHIERLSPYKTVRLHCLPVFIGVTLSEVEVSIHLTTLDVDVHRLIVFERLTVVEGTTDIVNKHVVLALIEDNVQSLLQVIVHTSTASTQWYELNLHCCILWNIIAKEDEEVLAITSRDTCWVRHATIIIADTH